MNYENVNQLKEMIENNDPNVCMVKNRAYYFNGDGADRKLYMLRVEDMHDGVPLKHISKLVSDRYIGFADCNTKCGDKYIYLRYRFTNKFYCKYDIYNDIEQACKGRLLGFAGDKPVVKLEKIGDSWVCFLEGDKFVRLMEYSKYLTYEVKEDYILLTPSRRGRCFATPYRCYLPDGRIGDCSPEEAAKYQPSEEFEFALDYYRKNYAALGTFEVAGDTFSYELVPWDECEVLGNMIIPGNRTYKCMVSFDGNEKYFVISYKDELSKGMRTVIQNTFNLPRRRVRFVRNIVG